MRIGVRRGDIAKRKAGAIALGIFERTVEPAGASRAVDRASRGAISRLLAHRDFRGRFLETALLYPSGLGAPRLILVGLGAPGALHPHRALQAAAIAARKARDLGARTLATVAL